MIKRYPHTAKLVLSTSIDDPDGMTTNDTVDIDIVGRFEPEASKSSAIDYKAKFYCNKLDVSPYSVDGQKLIINGRSFVVIMLHEFQTHCEIWLE